MRSDRARAGFVLPLSLFMLLSIAMLVAVLLDGSLQEVRTARGDLSAARAQALAGSLLASMIAAPADSGILALARGARRTTVVSSAADTTTADIQSLGSGLVRIVATARTWSFGIRADAILVGFARVVPDSAGSVGALRYRRLPAWWWAQLP
jgi:hypothetical protein